MNWNYDDPVFIVGVPRSGTSMLWNILIRLNEFKGTGEIIWNTETSIFKKYIRHMNNFFQPGEWPFWYEYYGGNDKYLRLIFNITAWVTQKNSEAIPLYAS